MINKSVDCWFVVVPGFSLSICADEAEMRKELDNNIKQQQQTNEYQATGQPVGVAINATIDKNEMNVQIISPPVTIQLSESWAPSS